MKTEFKSLLNRVDTRLAACAAAAATSLAVLPSSDASIVYVDLSGAPVSIPATIDGLYCNFVTGVLSGTTIAGWDFNPYQTGGNLTFFTSTGAGNNNQVVGSGTTISALTGGTLISGASTFATAGIVSTLGTAFRTTQNTAFVGIRFTNESTGIINYGWALLSTTTATGYPAALLGYAWENTGLGIAAGDTGVPEPSTVALLGVFAAGAFGVREWRKRKAA